MNVVEYAKKAVNELETNIGKVDNNSIEELANMIFSAKKIYVVAAGRSKLMLNAFAMRLMHLGFQVYVVGEIVTPAVEEGDLVIIGSGSGKTESLQGIARKSKALGAGLVVLTIYPDSLIAREADLVIVIGGRTGKVQSNVKTVQPGGNVFEQSMLIILDCLVVRLAEKGNIDISVLKRHANLE